MKRYLFTFALILMAQPALATEAYCTKFGKEENKPIDKVCKEGDIIDVTGGQILQFCDFSKQIFKTPTKDQYLCQYLGYVREYRSRIDGKLTPFIIDGK